MSPKNSRDILFYFLNVSNKEQRTDLKKILKYNNIKYNDQNFSSNKNQSS